MVNKLKFRQNSHPDETDPPKGFGVVSGQDYLQVSQTGNYRLVLACGDMLRLAKTKLKLNIFKTIKPN